MSGEAENSITRRARQLDALFCNHAPFEEINQFFGENQKNLIDIFQKMKHADKLFSEDFIATIDSRYVKDICLHMMHRSQHEYYINIFNSLSFVHASRLDTKKKALFWNLLSKLTISSYSEYIPDEFWYKDIFTDSIYASYPRVFRDKQWNTYDFIRERMLATLTCFTRSIKPDNELLDIINHDYASLFAMYHHLRGKRLTKAMLLYLLLHNAQKCFSYLLGCCSIRELYKYRTPEAWLFTVCRNCHAGIAVPLIQVIEEDIPGLVANAHDPWGNTLLWNTLVNHNDSVEEIQNTLINLRCDPDASNQWGLSFQIVKENTL